MAGTETKAPKSEPAERDESIDFFRCVLEVRRGRGNTGVEEELAGARRVANGSLVSSLGDPDGKGINGFMDDSGDGIVLSV